MDLWRGGPVTGGPVTVADARADRALAAAVRVACVTGGGRRDAG
jgi:hypothetical protein